MEITLDEINLYHSIGDKIEALAKAYYEEFIYCNRTYEYLGWTLSKDNEITIEYSYYSYNGQREHDEVTLTINELNGDMELIENYDNVFYRGELKNITDFHKTYCDRCGSQRCDRSEEWMNACPHYKEWSCNIF